MDLSKVNPYDEEAVKEMNALGELLLGVPYEKLICKELAKLTLSNNTKKMSLSNTSSVANAKDIMERNLAHLHESFTQYKEAVVISNVFTHFDTSGDNKIDRKEMDAILDYLGEKWEDEKTNKLMHILDHMVEDDLLQPTEFFFWFTWPAIDHSMSFEKKIDELKRNSKSQQSGAANEIETDTIALENSDIPEDPAEVKKVFGRFTQFQDALKIIFFFKTFDSNWDGTVNKKEFSTMLSFLEPGRWSPPEIDSLVAALDMMTKDKSIQLNEWFFWFTSSFTSVWEPAIHQAAAKKNKSQVDIPQRA